MGVGAFAEPLVVITLLFGGVYVNRNKRYKLGSRSRGGNGYDKTGDGANIEDDVWEASSETSSASAATLTDDLAERGGLLSPLRTAQDEPKWRTREVGVAHYRTRVTSPNTRVFKDYFLSRLLVKYPFLVEVWYWALIYWVYQLGRAFSALTLVEGTVNVARHHALQVIQVEQRLRIFWEPAMQQAFLRHEVLMRWTNRIYSYIHIPGTIFFLAWLFWYTTTSTAAATNGTTTATATTHRGSVDERRREKADNGEDGDGAFGSDAAVSGPALYQARRRTMAMCNLIAFVVFTAWPCMPPRLLSDPAAQGADADEGRRFGFVDTVHGEGGESSVWTQNKFCNQYAAMPSLHFGYSLLIGLTVALVPLSGEQRRRGFAGRVVSLPLPPLPLPFLRPRRLRLRLPPLMRLVCLFIGFAYPTVIFFAIVTTANHFILDAVAGACVCAAAWAGNRALLNLVPLEDYFLWCVRIHKP